MAYQFQDRILKEISGRRTVSLILPMGSGKTRIACLWAHGKSSGPRLVICPAAAAPVWEEEIGKWLKETAILIQGSRSGKIYKLSHMAESCWYIITYQSFRSISNYMLGATLPTVAILDESHAIQSPRAKVTR